MRKRVLLSLLLLLITISVARSENYYCVQVASSEKLEDLIPLFEKFKNMDNVRIEKIGGFYTLRIGFYLNKSDVLKILPEIKEKYRDAFVRVCEYDLSRVVFPKPEKVITLEQQEIEESKTTKENFLMLLEKNIEELKKLTEIIARGNTTKVKPFEKLESTVVEMYKQKEKSYKRAFPLYINGEFRYRGKALTGENLLGDKWYSYLGLKLSFFRRGFADFKYEKERAKFAKLFSEFDIQKEYTYLLAFQSQEEVFLKGLKYELGVVESEKNKTLSLLKDWVKFTESYDKSLGFPYRELIKKEELEGIESVSNGFFLKPMKINVEEFMKYYEKRKKDVEEYLKKFEIKTTDKWFYLRHTDLDVFARYYFAGKDGNTRDFWALGLRFELPIPYIITDLGKVDKLEILSFKERARLSYATTYSFLFDYISRINRNYSNIVNHLEQINVNFLEIEREIYFWKNGLREANYTLILRNLLDTYHRLEQLIYLKYINYVYIQKLIYFMDIKEEEIIRRILDG
ncbi:SPOR domain-containing protein [Aquifex aeolicus]|uniref:SPOR domain-containing protein n=1 Tax=Aquifex aeolicus (strain VF5) TaxID=224324 RepID=O67596_AQUAE|nr:SPOR domain-containing protein [Aquifex aeolicus]AAC07561.1 putative protein [Aquifex aeolicus VF5]